MSKIEHSLHRPGRILDGQPSAQRTDMPAAPQNKPHTGGVHKGNAREIQRQQFRKAVIYLRIDLPPQRLGGVVVDLAAEVGGKGAAARDE